MGEAKPNKHTVFVSHRKALFPLLEAILCWICSSVYPLSYAKTRLVNTWVVASESFSKTALDIRNLIGYGLLVIKSFVHGGLEGFFYDGSKKGIQPQHAQKWADILDRLDAAKVVKDMNFPGSDLHRLKGKMKELWSVKVSGNWRVVSSFKEGNAIHIDYIDYH